jgi:CRP-like cAMP-binding protein
MYRLYLCQMPDKAGLKNFILSNYSCPVDVLGEITEVFSPFSVSKGEYFLKEGTISNTYLFLQGGFMRAFTYDLDGNDVTTAFYKNNQIVFEAASFFRREKSRENIQALTDCTGYAISFDELNYLFHSIHHFREFGRMILVKGFVALKERTLSLINETAEQRYLKLISTSPEIFQYASLKTIASYLGITDSSLSRIRRDFIKK